MALTAPRAVETHDQLSAADAWAADIAAAAHERTVRAGSDQMAAFLQELVGQQLTALMTGVADPRAVGKWARGERVPRGDTA